MHIVLLTEVSIIGEDLGKDLRRGCKGSCDGSVHFDAAYLRSEFGVVDFDDFRNSP